MSNSQYIYTFKSEFESENGQVIKNEVEEVEIKDNKGIVNKYKDNKKISSKKIKEINQLNPFMSLGIIPSPKETQESPILSPKISNKTKTNKKVSSPKNKRIKSPKNNNKK